MLLASSEVRFLELLDSGGSTQVLRAEITATKKPVAAKLLPETSANDASRAREILNFKINFRHTNVARIEGLVVHDECGQLALLTEFSRAGSLQRILEERPNACTAERIRSWAEGIAQALLFAQQNSEGRVIHGAVEPSHVLLFDNSEEEGDLMVAKLIGLGPTRASQLREDSPFKNLAAVGDGRCVGHALLCRAPETFYGTEERPSPAADVYGFGAMLLIMLQGHPWAKLHPSDILQNHFGGICPVYGGGSVALGAEALVEIAHKCLAHRPQERPDIKQVISLLSAR